MSKTPATRTLSIRLPEDLADRLDAVARQHGTTRTAVLIKVLDAAIDTYSPATHSATRPQHDTLSGAIETIRIELDETIDRVARLERATRTATQTARQKQDDVTRDGQTFTTRELADRFGLDHSNASRDLKKLGFVRIGNVGKMGLWAQVNPPKNEI
jgi:predicted DNA-binding protein